MDEKQKPEEKYQLLPPEGGWGYVIAVAITLMMNVTLIPMFAFGIVFGKFLASIGDETTGTTLANGIFNTFFNATGLVANNLLQKYSYRVVALMGAVIFSIGSFATIFVTTLSQMVITFGVIQGLGMGLMVPAFFTALNCYFDKRLSIVNGICQAFMVAMGMMFPLIAQFFMNHFGFRGTVAMISGLSFNTILAAALLQPVERHLVKKVIPFEKEELLMEKEKYIMPKPRTSIISLGDRALSVTTLNKTGKKKPFWTTLAESMDLHMFKDPVYVNISIGLSLGFTGDVAFVSILPMILINAGFSTSVTAFFVSLFFASDLVGRIVVTFLSGATKIKNRYYFLGGSVLLVVFRTAFVSRNDYYWKMATVGCMGFMRAFIQTPLPVVISEQYSDNFSTAFSLYMVVCGLVSFLFGPLMSFVKAYTHSDVMVVHLLSLAYLTCALTWILELLFKKLNRRAK